MTVIPIKKAKEISELKILQDLYKRIPSFTCKEGCSDCCGTVPCKRVEKAQLPKAPVNHFRKVLDCPYLLNDDCSVYDKRPFICRLFGAVERVVEPTMACPRGCQPECPLTAEELETIVEIYRKISPCENVLLSEIDYDILEVVVKDSI